MKNRSTKTTVWFNELNNGIDYTTFNVIRKLEESKGP